ncbi:AMP-binding protein [Microbulbifer salipaludis]|uniref:AMP-binding protein n=1 Tax=Microbulbifer salipaludis TaxID=187980 RepID=A0ABS3E2C4_9GAMM|nr:AMP-binding protein [Microbulbifer salipaludis]
MESTPIDDACRSAAAADYSDTVAPSSHGIEEPVIRKIERNAEICPDKIAVTFRKNALSYGALISSARQLAAGLEYSGVSHRSRVAVVMYPCPQLVVSLLAIHLLGATYVPIDPSFPAARIEMILEDVQPAVILRSSEDSDTIIGRIPEHFSALLQCYDHVFSRGQNPLIPFREHPLKLADESHIFFTSGTTGRPKGAISSQLNLAHGMSSSAQCFELNRSHSILSVAGSSFSISTFELLSLLAAGGAISIVERSDILQIDRLFSAAAEVTVWHFVPTLLSRLIEFLEAEPRRVARLKNLQRILTGGDNVPPDLLCKIRSLLPWVHLYVNYGASETSCMVTYWPVADLAPLKTKIGRPQKNVRLLVLDKNGKEVGKGQSGELFVSSPGVIAGYLNREDLNQQKFREIDGRRYFATGDMTRVDEAGNYEMLGREDFQIQLNGNRIELLEVERTLKGIPGIKDCVVAAKCLNEESNSAALVAYILPDGSVGATVSDIKDKARGLLPEYMVPSLYLEIESVPTNHNGKVDRAKLPAPSDCRALQSNEELPLSNNIEIKVANIWRELLGANSVHANSQFFELGGDSISAVRLITKISTECLVNLSIADIVSNTTVRQQSALIERRQSNQDITDSASLTHDPGYLQLKSGRNDISPLLLINGVVEYLELAKTLSTDRSVYAIYLPEEMDLIIKGAASTAATTTDSIAGITELYLTVITSLQPKGPYYLAGKSFGGIIAIEVARELEKLGHEVAFTGLLDTVTPEAFTAHQKFHFRVTQHIKNIFKQGPRYLLERLNSRRSRTTHRNSLPSSIAHDCDEESINIRVRHQVRKNAIFTTRLSRIQRPVVLIKARDRKHLYGEKPSKDLGWNKYCENLITYEAPGNHRSLLMPGQAEHVARYLELHI